MTTRSDRPDTLPMGCLDGEARAAEAFEDALVRDTILAEAADIGRLDADRILEVCAPSPADAAIPEAPPAPPTRDDVEQLAATRARLAVVRDVWQGALTLLKACFHLILDEERRLKAEVATREADLRAAAEAAFTATGKARPAPGVHVKVFKTLAYDSAAVIAWAKASGAAHLVVTIEAVDTAKFEALVWARPSDYADLVTVVETPRAQLAADLAAALAAAPAPVSPGGE